MCYNLLGFDLFIDDNLKIYVLEVNHAPSMNLETSLDKVVKPRMIDSLFEVINLNLKD